MIDKKVVLVLGAGASQPYGFPLGVKLVTKLAKVPSGTKRQLIGWGFNNEQLNEFQRSLRRAKVKSIDDFLESRPKFIPLGKHLIAIELIRHEGEDLLYPMEDDWVSELFYFMSTPTLDEFGFNELTVVTYNYDRSFDQMLYHYLKEKYGASHENVLRTLDKIPIIHLHGKLGDLPHEGNRESQREYSSTINRDAVLVASNGIRVIHEDMDVETDPEYRRAHEAIRKAEYVVFLGFGYHQINVRRLRLPECCERLESAPMVHLAGTAFDLTVSEMNRVKRLFRNPTGAPQARLGLNLESCTCTEFLRNNHDLFMKEPSYPDYPRLKRVEIVPAVAAVEG